MIRDLSARHFIEIIEALNRQYRAQNRPYFVQAVGDGYALTLHAEFQSIADKLLGDARQVRLSLAAIDALAIVAYRQPVSKLEVDSIRGVESGGLLRLLVRRGLITAIQRHASRQRSVCYITTDRFLEMFGLAGLEDLPQTRDLQAL
jgi:segregation and condensation protein B